MQEEPLQDAAFQQAFDAAQSVRGVNINLTMGLFWIRSYTFLNLDKVNRTYLGIDIPKGGLTAQFYANVLQDVSTKGQSFPELSLTAWQATQNAKTKGTESQELAQEDYTYWLVGSYWSDRDPPDQTQRFLDEGL